MDAVTRNLIASRVAGHPAIIDLDTKIVQVENTIKEQREAAGDDSRWRTNNLLEIEKAWMAFDVHMRNLEDAREQLSKLEREYARKYNELFCQYARKLLG